MMAFLHDMLNDMRAGRGLTPEEGRALARYLGGVFAIQIAEQNELIVMCIEKHFAGRKESQQAFWFAKGYAEYRSSAWLRDVKYETCPPRHAGRPQAYFWRFLKIRDERDLGERQVRDILRKARLAVLTANF